MGLSFYRGPVGEPGGVHLPGLLRKKKSISRFLLDPEAITIQARGPSGTLVKEQGSPELILDYGAQRAYL